jgi:hypothetical protein
VDSLDNQVHPVDAIFPIHTARIVQSWFEEQEGEFNITPGQHSHQS